MPLPLLEFRTFITAYSFGQVVESNCNSITFLNTGTNIMNVENVAFQPSQSISFNGNIGEITNQFFNLSFTDIGGISEATIFAKKYVL